MGKGQNFAPEIKETAKNLYMQGFPPAAIGIQLGLRAATISKWREKGKWQGIRDKTRVVMVQTGMSMLSRETNAQLEHASGQLREQFAGILAKGAKALADAPVLASAGSVRDFGEALEPLVRSAKIVHSWGNEGAAGIILGDLLGDEREQQSSVEVAASVESLPCGPETTTGSVPIADAQPAIPQVTQATDSEPQA